MNLYASRVCYAGRALLLTCVFAVAPAIESDAGLIGPITPPTITVDSESFSGPAFTYRPALAALVEASEEGRGLKLGTEVALGRIQGNRAEVVVKELAFDPDPFVVNNLLITNTTSTTQIYTVGVALPTTFPAPNIISGSILTGVVDSSGNGTATIASVSPTPIYQAQIDGVTVATLQDHPFSVSVPPGTLNFDSASFGPTLNLVPVTSDIGIVLRFSLTAGDTASILSRFDVVIPEPASFGLGALALLAVTFGRWRRR